MRFGLNRSASRLAHPVAALIGAAVFCGLLGCGCSSYDGNLLRRGRAPDDVAPDAGSGPSVPGGGGGQGGASDAALPTGPGAGGTGDDSGAPDAGLDYDAGRPPGDAGGDGGGDVADAGSWSGWQKSITFDGSQVEANLTAFPVLVRLADLDLSMHAAADGSDIYFVDEEGAATLAHEVESYDSATGSLVAWVGLLALNAGVDTVIQLRYGDARPDRGDPVALWSDHHYVWHMAQDPGPGASGEIRDSTGRAHATASSTMTSEDLVDAVVGKGIDFDGSDDEITFVNDFTGTAHTTLSAWVDQRMDTDGMSDTVVSFGSAMTGQVRLLYSSHTSTNAVVGGFYNDDVDSSHTIEALGWHHVAWVWDGSSSRFYVDGALVSGPTDHDGADTMGSAGKIGNATWAPRFLRGRLDEVRVSGAARSAAWIEAEYENQRPGSTFLKALGPQQGP